MKLLETTIPFCELQAYVDLKVKISNLEEVVSTATGQVLCDMLDTLGRARKLREQYENAIKTRNGFPEDAAIYIEGERVIMYSPK